MKLTNILPKHNAGTHSVDLVAFHPNMRHVSGVFHSPLNRSRPFRVRHKAGRFSINIGDSGFKVQFQVPKEPEQPAP